MPALWQSFVQFFVSLRLTVALLALSIILIFWATLAQVDIGVLGVQQQFFHTFIVLGHLNGLPVPLYPGGYFLGGLLFVNLVAAHLCRFKLTARKLGIQLAHLGVILLLVGELLSGLWQQESQMTIATGETKSYGETDQHCELAIVDATDPQWDDVVAIPDTALAAGRTIQHPKLPFQVVPHAYFPNAVLVKRAAGGSAPAATTGAGLEYEATPVPLTYKEKTVNLPAAYVELVGPGGKSLGTWLVSAMIADSQDRFIAQPFDYEGHSWRLTLRFARTYRPFTLTLLKFTHDVYPGTDIPRNYSSRVRLQSADGRDDREVDIYMNNPLRYAGLTFYQAGFTPNDAGTILQVVSNPSWRLPYLSCLLVALGLVIQFGQSLTGFLRRRPAP